MNQPLLIPPPAPETVEVDGADLPKLLERLKSESKCAVGMVQITNARYRVTVEPAPTRCIHHVRRNPTCPLCARVSVALWEGVV